MLHFHSCAKHLPDKAFNSDRIFYPVGNIRFRLNCFSLVPRCMCRVLYSPSTGALPGGMCNCSHTAIFIELWMLFMFNGHDCFVNSVENLKTFSTEEMDFQMVIDYSFFSWLFIILMYNNWTFAFWNGLNAKNLVGVILLSFYS